MHSERFSPVDTAPLSATTVTDQEPAAGGCRRGRESSPASVPRRVRPDGEASQVMAVHDLAGSTTALAGVPSCPGCGWPVTLQGSTTDACCGNEQCLHGPVAAGEVALAHEQTGPGLPRPVMQGRPVPWVAPVVAGAVAWAALNPTRREEAERFWLCQVCGTALNTDPTRSDTVQPPMTAWLPVAAGEVASGGALHDGCLGLARKVCPVLREDDAYVFTEVRREEQADEWVAVIRRLAAFEDRFGRLPDVLPLDGC